MFFAQDVETCNAFFEETNVLEGGHAVREPNGLDLLVAAESQVANDFGIFLEIARQFYMTHHGNTLTLVVGHIIAKVQSGPTHTVLVVIRKDCRELNVLGFHAKSIHIISSFLDSTLVRAQEKTLSGKLHVDDTKKTKANEWECQEMCAKAK
jgi:hypothetical protein